MEQEFGRDRTLLSRIIATMTNQIVTDNYGMISSLRLVFCAERFPLYNEAIQKKVVLSLQAGSNII